MCAHTQVDVAFNIAHDTNVMYKHLNIYDFLVQKEKVLVLFMSAVRRLYLFVYHDHVWCTSISAGSLRDFMGFELGFAYIVVNNGRFKSRVNKKQEAL